MSWRMREQRIHEAVEEALWWLATSEADVTMSGLAASRLFDITGKVAVVTGGGRGIGLMIASALVAVRMCECAACASCPAGLFSCVPWL